MAQGMFIFLPRCYYDGQILRPAFLTLRPIFLDHPNHGPARALNKPLVTDFRREGLSDFLPRLFPTGIDGRIAAYERTRPRIFSAKEWTSLAAGRYHLRGCGPRPCWPGCGAFHLVAENNRPKPRYAFFEESCKLGVAFFCYAFS